VDVLALCQGLGLALAAGLIVGAVVPPVMPAWGVIAGAVPLGIVTCALALDGEGEPVWPALPIGIAAAALAAVVARDVVAGATRRVSAADAGTAGRPAAGGVPVIVGLAALVLALLSLFVPPVSLVALLALAWLWLARRRRAEQKHEGLRVLR
jgi:hypothetical protein